MGIDRDLQGQIWLKKSNFLVSPVEMHNHHLTRESWLPRLLHRPVSRSPCSVHTYIPRLFHCPDCFTVSTRCTYTDQGNRGYFGIYRLSCYIMVSDIFNLVLMERVKTTSTLQSCHSEQDCISIVYLNVHSDADQRKHQISASLAFVRVIHRWPVNSLHKASNAKNASIWWCHHEVR